MPGPIRPEEVGEIKRNLIPELVFDAVNELIARNLNGKQALILQEDIINNILSRMEIPDRNHVFANHWLDIEALYSTCGWVVEYDKPGHNETYPARFIFTKKT